jgi:hypothetical protein
VFALYNGLVFLPVLLSLFGPPPKSDSKLEDPKSKNLESSKSKNLENSKDTPLQNLPSPETEPCIEENVV